MKLLIVESPSKAKTLSNYLGKDYKVLSSFGHVRNIVSKPWAIDIENNFKITYEETEKVKNHFEKIRKAAKESESIYIATDPDREGEAIGWHIKEMLKEKLKLKDEQFKRVTFNEITKKTVINAISRPRDIDMNLVNAQQARSALDHIVGFSISPLLWSNLPGTRSAGRVQSIALMMICDRENEINKFIAQEYWSVQSTFDLSNEVTINANLISLDGNQLEKFDIKNKDFFENDVKPKIESQNFVIHKIENKTFTRKPQPPFITSTLQQEASKKLGFSPKKTMSIAQKLYEGISVNGSLIGIITYMRTDSIIISDEAISSIRSFLKNNYNAKYLPSSKNIYDKKIKNSQEAHEAIRPTNIDYQPITIKEFLTEEQYKLYNLIWSRTIASQASKAEYEQITIIISSQKAEFKTSQSILTFDGFIKFYGSKEKDNEFDANFIKATKAKIGSNIKLINTEGIQHFTSPQGRYTEASIIKDMEEMGIGRPSTYANTLSVLQEREYATIKNKTFYSSERGKALSAFLKIFFTNCMRYDFTAQMEENLDLISNAKATKEEVLKNFCNEFNVLIQNVKSKEKKEIINSIVDQYLDYIFSEEIKNLGEQCPKCQEGKLSLNFGKYGFFLNCNSYPKCNHISRIESNNSEEEIKNPIFTIFENTKAELKNGPYGPYFELLCPSTSKIKRFSVPAAIDKRSIDNTLAEKICSLPILLGKNKNEDDVYLGLGRFGPFIKIKTEFASVPLKMQANLFDLTLEEAIQIFEAKKQKNSKKSTKEKESTKVKKGRKTKST